MSQEIKLFITLPKKFLIESEERERVRVGLMAGEQERVREVKV